jgi:hypothetical protein
VADDVEDVKHNGVIRSPFSMPSLSQVSWNGLWEKRSTNRDNPFDVAKLKDNL